MAKENASLLHGRNTTPLTERQMRNVQSAFHFFDRTANVRFEDAPTRFRAILGDPEISHEILFGPDIFPGANIGNPNSCLSMRAAVVHELAHKARHENGFEVNDLALEHIDEALTSLSAVLQFQRKLEDFEILELVSDAIQRLQEYVQSKK